MLTWEFTLRAMRHMADYADAPRYPRSRYYPGHPLHEPETPTMTNTQIARVCHEANRAYCIAIGDPIAATQEPWDDSPPHIQKSALDGVAFHRDNPDAGDAASHENWLRFKEQDGWVYGPEKDFEKKTHPCMVPFHELPPEQQMKDRLFRAIVHALS